jgi:branched-chain amino acid transport system substrate-binding protein
MPVVMASEAVLAGCPDSGGATFSAPAASDCSGPIKIGVIVSLSGSAGPNGTDVLNAITVEADLINNAGGVRGRKLQVISRDIYEGTSEIQRLVIGRAIKAEEA